MCSCYRPKCRCHFFSQLAINTLSARASLKNVFKLFWGLLIIDKVYLSQKTLFANYWIINQKKMPAHINVTHHIHYMCLFEQHCMGSSEGAKFFKQLLFLWIPGCRLPYLNHVTSCWSRWKKSIWSFRFCSVASFALPLANFLIFCFCPENPPAVFKQSHTLTECCNI